MTIAEVTAGADPLCFPRRFVRVPPRGSLGDSPRRSVRRSAHDAPDAILIADAADLAVGKIDLDHVLRRADQAQGFVGVSVEYLGGVIAALVGRDIGVVAFD